MNDPELFRALSDLRELGYPSRPPSEGDPELEDNYRLAVVRGDKLEIEFHKNLLGRRDADGRVSILSRNLLAGTLLFVGLVNAEERRHRWPLALPTPFLRDFAGALGLEDNRDRALRLLGLASRLSWSVIKESVLAAAVRAAQLVEDRSEREQLVARVEAQHPQPSNRAAGELVPTISEPDCEDGLYRGRFVMLRPVGADEADGLLSQGQLAALEKIGDTWAPFAKAIYFAAEVEAAPALVRRSLREACEHDPASLPFWREWLQRELVENDALRADLLAHLPPAD